MFWYLKLEKSLGEASARNATMCWNGECARWGSGISKTTSGISTFADTEAFRTLVSDSVSSARSCTSREWPTSETCCPSPACHDGRSSKVCISGDTPRSNSALHTKALQGGLLLRCFWIIHRRGFQRRKDLHILRPRGFQ